MIDKLKQKWGVNNLNLTLIVCTFAFGGSLCGFLARNLLLLIEIEKGSIQYIALYILAMTLLWPVSVITVSIFLGQFKFFKNYLIKIYHKIFSK